MPIMGKTRDTSRASLTSAATPPTPKTTGVLSPPESPLIGDPAAGVRTGAALRHAIDNHMLYFEDGTRTSQDFANIIAGGKQTTDEEWAAIKAARAKENNGH